MEIQTLGKTRTELRSVSTAGSYLGMRLIKRNNITMLLNFLLFYSILYSILLSYSASYFTVPPEEVSWRMLIISYILFPCFFICPSVMVKLGKVLKK